MNKIRKAWNIVWGGMKWKSFALGMTITLCWVPVLLFVKGSDEYIMMPGMLCVVLGTLIAVLGQNK